jgi:hypothetical protein
VTQTRGGGSAGGDGATSRHRTAALLWAPERRSWWIAVLFAAGSTCFLIAPLGVFLDAVGPEVDGAVFFVGSLLFTSAATLQWLQAINPDPPPGPPGRRPRQGRPRQRRLTWEPHRGDWWSSAVQLLGTVFFNISTFRALTTALGSPSYDRLVWRPDAFGSVCFLVSGAVAYAVVAGGLLHRTPHTLDGAVAAVNLAGCVAFGVSAVAAYVLPTTGSAVNVAVVNAATSLGALGFLVGALLLLPLGARAEAAGSPAR